LTGFTFPTNENPKSFDFHTTKRTKKYPLVTQDAILVYTFGIENVQITIEGDLTSKANFRLLHTQATKSKLYQDGSITRMDYRWAQRLYISNSTYFLVKNASFKGTRLGSRPNTWSYIITFDMEASQLWDDNENLYSGVGS
jgi:hypothetical protein